MNLSQLKQNARMLMAHRYPGGQRQVLTHALIFLLATSWVSLISSLALPSPLDAAIDKLLAATATGSSLAVDAAVSSLPSLFQPLSARLGLFCAVLMLLYTLVVDFGYSDYALKVYRGGKPGPGAFFRRFDLCGKIILLSLVIYLFTYLWSLLFLIPGIVAWYRYRMSRYVLLDHPEMGVLTAWGHSKRMMKGFKAQLFLLDLSFVGWMFLANFLAYLVDALLEQIGVPLTASQLLAQAVFTAVYVYLTPYMELSYVGFYHMICPAELLPTVSDPDGDSAL